ncbi:MAG: CotH kinase family protein [Acidobacteriota bacterium]
MNRRAILLLIAAAVAGPVSGQRQADLFDGKVLHEVRLAIHPADWRRLQEHYLDNTYYPCDFEWRGRIVANSGVRSRGRGSRSADKPNLRLDFNYFEAKQEFLGLKAINLKANNQDASLLRERLAMAFFQRVGLPAPRVAHARLYVNDEYAGLYLIMEEVDKRFLKRTLDQDDGYLYKLEPPGKPYHFEYFGPDPALYSPSPFEPKTHEKDPDPAPLEAMLRLINTSSDADFERVVGEYLDLRLFLTYVAVESVLADYDGVLGTAIGTNNFYLYRFERSTLFQFIPWDKDGAFNWEKRSVWDGADLNVLMRRATALPELRRVYLDALLSAAAALDGWLEQEILRQYEQIRTAAYEDSHKLLMEAGVLKPSSNAEFEASVLRLLDFARLRADFVRREVSQDWAMAPAEP